MKMKARQKIGLIMLLLIVLITIVFFNVGTDDIWDSALGRAAAITLTALWVISIIWQIAEAIVYFLKNK